MRIHTYTHLIYFDQKFSISFLYLIKCLVCDTNVMEAMQTRIIESIDKYIHPHSLIFYCDWNDKHYCATKYPYLSPIINKCSLKGGQKIELTNQLSNLLIITHQSCIDQRFDQDCQLRLCLKMCCYE